MLAYLVCERHRTVSRAELAELLWGERLPGSWSESVSAVISKLRRLLGEAGLDPPRVLASAFGSYRLHLPDDVSVDWEALAGAVERAEHAGGVGEFSAALVAAGEARVIAQRGFHTDECDWVDAKREQLKALHLRVIETQIRAHLAVGELARAVIAAREGLALDDLHEASYRLLMHAFGPVRRAG